MFENALEEAMVFTKPIITTVKTFRDKVESIPAAYIVINNDGWILTAAHVISPLIKQKQDKLELDEYEKKVKGIRDSEGDPKKIRKKINKLIVKDDWLVSVSPWLGNNNLKMDGDVFFNFLYDLAIVKIKDFKPEEISIYPRFKKAEKLRVGATLCKLGFPFANIESSFDHETNNFKLEKLDLTYFPLEGMYTRNIVYQDQPSGGTTKFIETSTPGIKGQSGGPIIDKKGVVWGIQSRTINFPLDFSPIIEKNGKKIEENQFLNVSWGVHPEIIVRFLKEHNIDFSVVD